jgi:hypothetical protein
MGTRKNFVVPGGITVDSSTLYVDDPNNRVGIGKTNPDHALDVSGVIKGSNGVITLTTSGTPSSTIADGAIAVDTQNNKFYFRSGSSWVEAGSAGGGGGSLTISVSAPGSPSAGDLWFKSDVGSAFVYYDSYWVEIGATDTDSVTTTIAAKGDLIAATGVASVERLGVGSNGQVLVADSDEATGLKWSSTITAPTVSGGSITDATVSGGSVTNAIVQGLEESWNVAATAATGTVDFDTLTSTAWLYTSNASGNWTLNVRGDGSTTLASLLDTGDSVTVVFAVTNGSTAYYNSAFQIDGSSVTPEWQGGEAPTEGNASSVDVYVYTIIKTAATPTYTVLASQTQFA